MYKINKTIYSNNKRILAFLAVLDQLSCIPQSYILQISNWNNWSESEWINFNYLVNEWLNKDNSLYNLYYPDYMPDDLTIIWNKYQSKFSK